LLIVGDGPERPRLEADLCARGLRELTQFTGSVDSDEVPGLLASMEVAVAPYPKLASFYFSPLKVYEYMAAGLPIVASRIGQLAGGGRQRGLGNGQHLRQDLDAQILRAYGWPQLQDRRQTRCRRRLLQCRRLRADGPVRRHFRDGLHIAG